MTPTKQKTLLFFLLIFSIYCALTIGQSWDEETELLRGKITLEYLLSLGDVDKKILYREYYSPIYWSLSYLLTKIFPSQFQIEAGHIINLFFSLSVIFGIGKFSKELFNKKVGKLCFLILFFYPIFFGHMAMNNKDMILALSHVWITYLIFRYFKIQNIKETTNKYIIYIGVLAAVGSGIQLVFLGSLIPIFIFTLAEIFFFKKFINKNFSKKKLFYDLIKCFIIFYSLLVLFWIDVHSNILILPFNLILEVFSTNYLTGWPHNLVSGNYYLSREVPKSYLLINLFYKSPEYLLITYLFFIILLFSSKKFFLEKFKFFNYKLSLLILFLFFPNLISFIIPYPQYDGMRLFLWTVPYYCLIPGLTIYYLIENFHFIKPKLASLFLSLFIIYFLFNFFTLTPYQYTYLNVLNGNVENRYKKFENDYWGSSIKELIKNADFKNDRVIKIAVCGVPKNISKKYLKRKEYLNFEFVSVNQADYIIMTNRVMYDLKNPINCFDKFRGKNVSAVIRNGLMLSVIRKI